MIGNQARIYLKIKFGVISLLSCLFALLADNLFAAESVQRVSSSFAGAQADGGSYAAVLSANLRYVVFESVATNLVASNISDIFLKDTKTKLAMRLAVDGPF